MYLDIVVVDYLSQDGILHNFKIAPNDISNRVIIDRLRDIDRSYSSGEELDIGSFRIYNHSECLIRESKTKLRNIIHQKGRLEFMLEHLSLPVGKSKKAHHGYYCLLLPVGFQLTELYVLPF